MEWKKVKGFEELYEVSNTGLIKSLGQGISTDPRTKEVRILKTAIKNNGYVQVKLCKNGTHNYRRVHRLVAIAFIPNPHNLKEINHIDGDKTNNADYNLEWCTSGHNQRHAFLTGLQKPIRGKDNKHSLPILQFDLNGVLLKEWDSIKQILREEGFNTFGIIKCCKKEPKYKTAYGFKWAYKYESGSN